MEKLFESIGEHPEPEEAEITGSIPDWVEGHLFRAGPAKWDFEDGFSLNHYSDGTSLMYKFTIEKGNVTVKTKFLDSEAYQKLLQFNRPIFTEYGTRSYPDLCKSIFQRERGGQIVEKLLETIPSFFNWAMCYGGGPLLA
ncbi:beta,beta-carotene 9',10'-oxygenase [Trichonephila clavata]|uniref:Beta,beta-carotene 9',10'-oxygenase n=1 Tax=Trichonephila clavata TaxID=2740835 RepID=A0A8X6KKC6_TRICU|nr:beta,beta-carotene 9',10'-oxygenase [Trichonephila clavata]